jgi:plasmid stability protein
MDYMADLRVRDIDDWVMEALRTRAKRHGRFLADEIRDILRGEATRPRREFAAEARAMREELFRKHGLFPDSAAEIRQDRDQRG